MYRTARERQADSTVPSGRLFLRDQGTPDPRRYNASAAPREVAAIVPGTDEQRNFSRDIVVQGMSMRIQRICENHPSVEALTYPILNPTGEPGYHIEIPLHRPASPRTQSNTDHNGDNSRGGGRTGGARRMVSKREYTAYRLTHRVRQQPRQSGEQPLPFTSMLHRGGRLLQQWVVDYASQIEHERLQYQRSNQATLRQHERRGLSDALQSGQNPQDVGRTATILSSSFTGGPRYMTQRYLDAMAIVRQFGKPDLFVTFTCNPSKPIDLPQKP